MSAPIELDRLEGLRRKIPAWNAELYRQRPDLDPNGFAQYRKEPKAEWRVDIGGRATLHPLTAEEIAIRRGLGLDR